MDVNWMLTWCCWDVSLGRFRCVSGYYWDLEGLVFLELAICYLCCPSSCVRILIHTGILDPRRTSLLC